MTWFLLVYHRSRRALVDRHDYSASSLQDAVKERAILTEKFISDPEVEVVLLGAQSEDDLRITHRRYFSGEERVKQAQ